MSEHVAVACNEGWTNSPVSNRPCSDYAVAVVHFGLTSQSRAVGHSKAITLFQPNAPLEGADPGVN